MDTKDLHSLIRIRKWDVDEIMKLAPLEERVYRHRCVEAWSIVVPWIGFSLSNLIKQAEPAPERQCRSRVPQQLELRARRRSLGHIVVAEVEITLAAGPGKQDLDPALRVPLARLNHLSR